MRKVLWIILACFFGFANSAFAQFVGPDSRSASSYITPFPAGDTYRVQVYGDWMAESLLHALAETLQSEPRLQVIRKPRTLSPLIRYDHEEEVRAEEQSRDTIHIAVMFFGISDRSNFRQSPSTPVLRLGSEPWQLEYGRRVDRLLKALKRRGIAVYLVGQPPLRREEANTDAMMVSEILRDKALINGVRYVDIYPAFVDEEGDYTQYGPDYAGNSQKLRESDGVSMSWAGNRKIAAMVDKEVRKDLAIALAERAVPLAGAETEQRRINPDKPYASQVRPAGSTPQASVLAGNKQQSGGQSTSAAIAASPAQAQNPRQSNLITDQKSDTARVVLRIPGPNGRDESVTSEIVRPPISAATLTLLKRKEAAQSTDLNFDTIAAELSDGTTLSLFVTPTKAMPTAQGTKNSGVEYYTAVWVRGDRLKSKPGRADDFRWPPPDEIPYAAASEAQPVQAPAAQLPATSRASMRRNNPAPSLPKARLDTGN